MPSGAVLRFKIGPEMKYIFITGGVVSSLGKGLTSGALGALLDVNRYGSGHSDLIVTENAQNAEKFMNLADSATVYWNASTRFTDGCEFGLGAEIGISTDKLHARGPMGLRELCSYKYKVRGSGQTRGAPDPAK